MWTRLVLTLTLCLLPAVALGATITVENNGLDGPSCGTTAAPCRSISKGVARAAVGDTVLVGPGYYSDDLDSDGVFGEPGEEPTGGILINKRVTVQSRYGASETYVAFRTANISIFNLAASGVTLGKVSKGFSVSVLEGSVGVSIQQVDGITVSGMQISTVHLATSTTTVGISIAGTHVLVQNNRVVGFGVSGDGADICYASGSGSSAPTVQIDRNVAQGCNIGFLNLGYGGTFTRNLAIGNRREGFDIAAFVALTDNAAYGNGDGGAVIGGMPGVVSQNVFVGNAHNCGVTNDDSTAGTLNASNNYWGAPTGPGSDPADSTCSSFGGVVTTVPFLTNATAPTQVAQR
jgi:hypothetical protein